MKTYKTVTGYAIHGHTENLASLRAMFADGHVPMLFKFFNCDAGYIAGLQDAFPTDTAFVVRYFERGAWHSDRSKEWLSAFPSIRAAAESYMNHFAADFTLLAGIPRTVYVENFNEPSVDSTETIARLCEFNAEVGKLIKVRYGEELKLAALSLSSGTFNELPMAQIIADRLIRPLMASNVEFALSLHCYSSLAMPVWNEPYLGKTDIQRIYREGNPAVEINLDAPIRLDLSLLPAAYTGFGHERLYVHLRDISIGGEDLHEVPMMITESLIDNMGDPGIGDSAGGYLEWERKELLSRIKRQNESAGYFAARNMIYAERRYQAEIKAGVNLVGVTPFVYDDINHGTRWWLDFGLKGEPYNVFKDAMRINGIEQPIPDQEEWPKMPCQIVVTATPSLNVRSKPGTEGAVLGTLPTNAKAEAIAQFKNSKNETWIKIKYVAANPDAWVTNTYVRLQDCPSPLPLWAGETQQPPAPSQDHPDTLVLRKLKPILERMNTHVAEVRADVTEALAVANIELEQPPA